MQLNEHHRAALMVRLNKAIEKEQFTKDIIKKLEEGKPYDLLTHDEAYFLAAMQIDLCLLKGMKGHIRELIEANFTNDLEK